MTVINCSESDPCQNGAKCIDAKVDQSWSLGVCRCTSEWQGRICDTPREPVLRPADFATNYNYPIIHFSPVHPANLVGLHSDVYSGNDTVAHAKLLDVAISTVWGDNERSKWRPVNGLCLAWPSATRVTDGALPGRSAALLDRYEDALDHTMQPNFWPSMGGGGLEQVGATLAVNELLLQSHEGFLALFPAWGEGEAASFTRLRARGAFLVSASISTSRTVGEITILSEKGARCRVLSPWGSGARAPHVQDHAEGEVAVVSETMNGLRVWAFDTMQGHSYILSDQDSLAYV